MKRRMTAVLLVLGLALTTLAGCGRSAADRFFDVTKEIMGLQDYHLELTVSTDQETKNGVRISGDVAESEGQAQLTMTGFSESVKQDGTLDMVVDGSDIYVRPGDWTRYLASRFANLGEGIEKDGNAMEGELLTDGVKDLGDGYYKMTTPEPVFDLLRGKDQQEAVNALSDWYKALRKDLKQDIQSEDDSYTLSLTGERLVEQQLSRLEDLLGNEETYRKALLPAFAGAEDAITASGWSDGDILDTMWAGYQEQSDTLTQRKEDEDWGDGSITVTNRAVGSDGAYQISAEWTDGTVNHYLQANVQPAETPAHIQVPKKATDYSKQAENLAMVYMDTRTLLTFRPGSSDDSESEEEDSTGIDWDQWADEHEDDTEAYSADLELTPIDGSSHIALAAMETEDGVKADLPVVTDYDYCDATEGEEGGSNALNLTSDSWEVNLYNMEQEGRSMSELLSESVNSYLDIFQQDYGYKITQEPGKVQKNKDGTACTSGFRYYDQERGCEVTLISLVTELKDSDYDMIYELSIYSDKVSKDQLAAISELCDYYHLKVPVTVAQQK